MAVDLVTTSEGQKEQRLAFEMFEGYRNSFERVKVHRRNGYFNNASSLCVPMDKINSQSFGRSRFQVTRADFPFFAGIA